LYPGKKEYDAIAQWNVPEYICVAPASVWFTKQFPADQWITFINLIREGMTVYLLGAPNDHTLCETIRTSTSSKRVINLAGKLNFLQSAALMKNAQMNYVNDSAPMHFASSVNASVAAVYCSTIPGFGFGPLSDNSHVIEVAEKLSCRPCGLHGMKACPLGHFNCARKITSQQLLAVLSK
jgi:heptosyltransferase-2